IQSQLTQIRKVRSEGKWSTPSMLGVERKINPFLRCHDQTLQKHVTQKHPDINLNPISIFTFIRKLKDQF
ncbi:MAG: hydroxyacylglutathione hydrolase C-terminal domain-containing protein, partial [SAR324 cluster bacterium]|nr:hydroxyacylglutathione hydrolase C-terminal domain-containing protein [SAR324 cluster bacterium]